MWTCSSNQSVADSDGLLARTGESRSSEQSVAFDRGLLARTGRWLPLRLAAGNGPGAVRQRGGSRPPAMARRGTATVQAPAGRGAGRPNRTAQHLPARPGATRLLIWRRFRKLVCFQADAPRSLHWNRTRPGGIACSCALCVYAMPLRGGSYGHRQTPVDTSVHSSCCRCRRFFGEVPDGDLVDVVVGVGVVDAERASTGRSPTGTWWLVEP